MGLSAAGPQAADHKAQAGWSGSIPAGWLPVSGPGWEGAWGVSGQIKSGLRLHGKSCGFVTELICLISEKLTCA